MHNTHNMKRVNPVVVGVTGILVGAAGTVIAATFMNQETRKKIGTRMDQVKGQVIDCVKRMQTSSHPMWRTMRTVVGKMTGKANNESESQPAKPKEGMNGNGQPNETKTKRPVR